MDVDGDDAALRDDEVMSDREGSPQPAPIALEHDEDVIQAAGGAPAVLDADFDVLVYISQYTGSTRIRRLLFIAAQYPAATVEALS